MTSFDLVRRRSDRAPLDRRSPRRGELSHALPGRPAAPEVSRTGPAKGRQAPPWRLLAPIPLILLGLFLWANGRGWATAGVAVSLVAFAAPTDATVAGSRLVRFVRAARAGGLALGLAGLALSMLAAGDETVAALTALGAGLLGGHAFRIACPRDASRR